MRRKVWEDILEYSLAQQEDSGPEVEIIDPADRSKKVKVQARGFHYIKGDDTHGHIKGSMTACALANIEMARYVLSDNGSNKGKKKWAKRDDAKKVQDALYSGVAWLNNNWSSFRKPDPAQPKAEDYHVYYLYAVERAMDLFKLTQIDSHNWYSEMGQELINRQYEDGHWDSNSTHSPGRRARHLLRTALPQACDCGLDSVPDFTGGGGEAPDTDSVVWCPLRGHSDRQGSSAAGDRVPRRRVGDRTHEVRQSYARFAALGSPRQLRFRRPVTATACSWSSCEMRRSLCPLVLFDARFAGIRIAKAASLPATGYRYGG